ncbi:MAG TPA: hypothetical protein DCF84_00840 [Bacteroidetes bacterium]|nr:hypothetical protein [Bacteroidota bacterium]
MRYSLISCASVILWISSLSTGRAQSEYFENRIPLGGFVDTGNTISAGYYSVDAHNGNLYPQNIPGLDTFALASSITNRGIFYPARALGSNASSDAYIFLSNQSTQLNYKVAIPSLQTGITSYLTISGLFSYDEFFYSQNRDNLLCLSPDSINTLTYNNQNQLLPDPVSVSVPCYDSASVKATAYSAVNDKAYFYYYDTATLGSVMPYLSSFDANNFFTNRATIPNPIFLNQAEIFYHDSVDRLIGLGQKPSGEVVIFSMDTLGNQILEYNVPVLVPAPTVISIPKYAAALSTEDNILYFQLVTSLGQVNEQTTLYSYRLEDVVNRKLTAQVIPATIKHLHATPTVDGLVFAGDVNRDGNVNFVDFLSFAPSFSVTGDLRSALDQNIDWVGYASSDWLDTTIASLNLKNADCNGNGIIDSADVQAFLQNYRAEHNSEKSASGQQNCPYEFYFVMPDSVFFGDSVTIGIGLDLPSEAASGVALELNLDTSTLINEGRLTATFPPSWIGEEGVSTLSIQRRDSLEGQLDFALSQNTTSQVAGSGVFAEIIIVTPDEVVKKASSQELLIPLGFQETYIQFINGTLELGCFLPDTLRVVEKQTATTLSEIGHPGIQVYPNPSDNVWQINASHPWTKLEVVNSLGQILYQEVRSNSMTSIPTEAIHNEFSVLILYYPTTIETLPLLKLHE